MPGANAIGRFVISHTGASIKLSAMRVVHDCRLIRITLDKIILSCFDIELDRVYIPLKFIV